MGIQTAERISQHDPSDNFVFQRSILAYYEAAKLVSGKVLEIGTGSGYGVSIIAPKAERLVSIDKFETKLDLNKHKNVEFRQMSVPPLDGIPDSSFDYVVSFQVIEHIQDDNAFVSEVSRVLKPGGKFILTTPNAPMSLTRNPWHIREYTPNELGTLLQKNFSSIKKLGVFGNEAVMAYYKKNKESVEKITRFDFLNLQYKLPRQLLQIPYDILNRYNRNKLLKQNTSITAGIKMEDYSIGTVTDDCFDLFYIATK
jgi:SAM-dependent methyltransferase